MRAAALALLVACGSSGAPPPPAPVPAPAPAPRPRASGMPARFEVYAALLAARDTPLADVPSCEGVVGVELGRPAVLGDWIAYNLSVLEEAPVSLPVECRAVPGRAAEWECDVTFQAGQGGESPWSWGVRVRMRDSDATVVPGSLMCTGAG